MRIIICLLLFFIGYRPNSSAQQLYPLIVQTDSADMHVQEVERRLSLTISQDKNDWFAGIKLADVQQILLNDADLQINYRFDKKSKPYRYTLDCWLKDSKGLATVPKPYQTNTLDFKDGTGQLNWMDITELPLVYAESYQIFVKTTLWGPVDCSAGKPVFSLKKQLPYYAVGIAGLTTLGIGLSINQQKKTAYKEYLNKWGRGEVKTNADEHYLLASKKERQARAWLISSAVILGMDVLLWGKRAEDIKKKQKRYNRFCVQTTSIGYFSPFSSDMQLAAHGLLVTCQF
ncbi:MAG: hypothetical protein JNM22_12760 [Saprospiraceae bacterium]|nr:hypothetical protein [Saprospiraceae bacterium]